MSFLDENNIDIRRLQKFAFLTEGLVHTFGQKIEVSLPCFLSSSLIKKNV